MFERIQTVLSVTAAAGLLSVTGTWAQEGHPNLISVDELQAVLESNEVLLLDAQPTQFYLEAHIPGAHSVSFTEEESISQGVNVSYGGGVDYFTDTDFGIPFQERPPEEMEELFRDWGIDQDSNIVIYDQGGTFFGTRLFYSLYYHGFPLEQLRILDGGIAKWQAEGYEVTSDIPAAPAAGDFAVAEIREDSKAGVEEFLAASGDRENNILIEALGPDWHFGEALHYSRRGHIPFAKMVPSPEFFNEDKTFKSPEELRAIAELVGYEDGQTIYTHCGGGIAGSLAYFALKFLADYDDVKHFPESQLGWLADERELPYWTYDAPYLLRDTDWLQWWGGQRTRTLGSTHVSIVDIRSEEDYGRRHVPFALNVPATEFASGTDGDDALRARLGEAGIDPAHEAVIISDHGLDKEAALAFVRLEHLGQEKVSIFTDSVADWVGAGYPVRDEPTVVAPRQSRHDLAIPPVEYASASRDGVIAESLNGNASTSFPRVLIASGASVPNVDAGDAGIVHVPYDRLLDDGVPKDAAEIWTILEEAGVLRFAELVTISDDPGEAAVNYVVLKLMGFPSVSADLSGTAESGT